MGNALVRAHVRVSLRGCVSTCVYVRVCACVRARIYVCGHWCSTHTHIHTHTHTHTHTHAHAHTQASNPKALHKDPRYDFNFMYRKVAFQNTQPWTHAQHSANPFTPLPNLFTHSHRHSSSMRNVSARPKLGSQTHCVGISGGTTTVFGWRIQRER